MLMGGEVAKWVSSQNTDIQTRQIGLQLPSKPQEHIPNEVRLLTASTHIHCVTNDGIKPGYLLNGFVIFET